MQENIPYRLRRDLVWASCFRDVCWPKHYCKPAVFKLHFTAGLNIHKLQPCSVIYRAWLLPCQCQE